jgi:hypothetical protein
MDDWGSNDGVTSKDIGYKKSKLRVGITLGVITMAIVVMVISLFVYKMRTVSLKDLKQENVVQDYKTKEDVADNSANNTSKDISAALENNKNSVERFGTVVDGDSFAMLGKVAVLNYKVVEKDYNIGLVYDNGLVYVGYTDTLPVDVLERYGVKETDSNYEVRDFKGRHYFVKKGVEFVDV